MCDSLAGLTLSCAYAAQVKAESLNGHCSVPERVTHDHLDDIAAAMMKFMLIVGMVWHFFARLPLTARSLLSLHRYQGYGKPILIQRSGGSHFWVTTSGQQA